MRGTRIAKIVIALAIVGIGYAAVKDDIAKLWQDFHVKLVEHPKPKKTVWLDQGIAKEKLSWFYHADQGTRTFGIPYEWFMALEQPVELASRQVGLARRRRDVALMAGQQGEEFELLRRELDVAAGGRHPVVGGVNGQIAHL